MIWKFNTQLLKSDSFCTAVNDFWFSWRGIKSTFTDPRVWWDAGKLQLKELAVSHSVNGSREKQREILSLEREFRNILSRGNPNTIADHDRLTEIKTCLQALSDQAVKGAIIRSKEQ